MTTTATQIMPFYGRVLLIASPVDEDERPSGLIVPLKVEGGADYNRGVLVALSGDGAHPGENALEVGMVVYYRRGWKIRDWILVDLPDILAYEPVG